MNLVHLAYVYVRNKVNCTLGLRVCKEQSELSTLGLRVCKEQNELSTLGLRVCKEQSELYPWLTCM